MYQTTASTLYPAPPHNGTGHYRQTPRRPDTLATMPTYLRRVVDLPIALLAGLVLAIVWWRRAKRTQEHSGAPTR